MDLLDETLISNAGSRLDDLGQVLSQCGDLTSAFGRELRALTFWSQLLFNRAKYGGFVLDFNSMFYVLPALCVPLS